MMRRMLPVRDGMAFLKQLKRNPVQEWLTPDLWSRLAERAAIQMLQAVSALHEERICHNDVSSANVMMRIPRDSLHSMTTSASS